MRKKCDSCGNDIDVLYGDYGELLCNDCYAKCTKDDEVKG